MTHKIPIAGGILRRNNSESPRKRSQGKGLLHIKQPILFKTGYGLLPYPLLLTEREVRIYVIYGKGKPVKLAESDLGLYQDRHPFTQPRSRHRLEIRGYEPVS